MSSTFREPSSSDSLSKTSLPVVLSREKEVSFISNFLFESQPLSQCLVISGPSGCGKSYLISKTLSHCARSRRDFMWINISCIELPISSNYKSLFDAILTKIRQRYLPDWAVSHKPNAESDSFFRELHAMLTKLSENTDKNGSLLDDYLSSRHISSSCRVTSLMVSTIAWEAYNCGTFHVEPITMTMDNYSRDQMTTIMRSLPIKRSSDEHYYRFIDLLLTICYPVCRSAEELIYILKHPEDQNQTESEKDWIAWKSVQPAIKRALNNLYLRSSQSAVASRRDDDGRGASELELPYFARIMLIAAYIASNSQVSMDKRNFVKADSVSKGPQLFTLERLFAIFCSVLHSQSVQVSCSGLLISQVACLQDLGLLVGAGSKQAVGSHDGFTSSGGVIDYNLLANPRYRCCASFETVQLIAKSVDFNLSAHLADSL